MRPAGSRRAEKRPAKPGGGASPGAGRAVLAKQARRWAGDCLSRCSASSLHKRNPNPAAGPIVEGGGGRNEGYSCTFPGGTLVPFPGRGPCGWVGLSRPVYDSKDGTPGVGCSLIILSLFSGRLRWRGGFALPRPLPDRAAQAPGLIRGIAPTIVPRFRGPNPSFHAPAPRPFGGLR